jgi:geranylgeranyl diphosphate synthase type I
MLSNSHCLVEVPATAPDPTAPTGQDRPGSAAWHLALAELWTDPSYIVSMEGIMQQLCFAERDPALGQLVWEQIATGGKRLRARLALFAAKALGGQIADGVAWGACCELLHNASLIHDDIQDGDRFRRGRPALWARYGTAQAINAGDLSIALSYLAIGVIPVSDAMRWRLTETVSLAARRVVAGQAAELQLLSAELLNWETYASCVEGKTAALFSLPLEGAAIIAGRSREEARLLGDAFRSLGLLFQIQDDILDLYGDNGREMRGSDLAQSGKATAFVVEHLRLHPADRDWLVKILTAPRADTSPEEIDRVIARFADDGALVAVWQRVDALRHEIANSLVLAREPALRALAERFVAEALRPVSHTRPL